MQKFYIQESYDIFNKLGTKMSVHQLIKLLTSLKDDIYKFELYKKYSHYFYGNEIFQLINSIDDFRIKRCILEQADQFLSLEQIAKIVMNMKRKNERNYLLQFYSDKLGDKIFDFIGNSFLLNQNELGDEDYGKFLFIVFGYRIAHLSDVVIKDISYNEELNEQQIKGTFSQDRINLSLDEDAFYDFYNCADLINTIFHEIEHAIQSKLMKSNITIHNLNYTYLKIIKEEIVSLNNSLYDDGNVNYQLESFEVDATLKSIIKTFKLISRYNLYLATLYLDDMESTINLTRRLRNVDIRLKCDSLLKLDRDFLTILSEIDYNDKTTLQNMFDGLSDILEYRKLYPLLSLEYDQDGLKLTDTQIESRIQKCISILNEEKFKNCNLELIEKLKWFYKNMLRDRNKNKELTKSLEKY